MPVCSLIINVYNMADRLAVVLPTVVAQSCMDFEVVIADDGSCDATPELVAAFKAEHPGLHTMHVWHPDQGFWRTGILNKAFVAARTAYIIVVDGDMLLHPNFVAAHLRYRAANRVLAGYRGVTLNERLSASLIGGHTRYAPTLRWLLQHRLTGELRGAGRGIEIHASLLRHWLDRGSQRLSGCNFSLDKALLAQVNGMDNTIREYGYEDFELGHRLSMLGAQIFDVSRRAVTYHLAHQKGAAQKVDEMKALIRTNTEPVARFGMIDRERGSELAKLLGG